MSLLACDSLEDVFLAVADTNLKNVFPRLSSLGDADAVLSGLANEEFNELRKLCPNPAIADLLLMQNEFYNTKGHLKAKLAEIPFTEIPNGSITAETVERLWNAMETPFDDVMSEPFAAIHNLATELKEGLPTLIDWVLDNAFLCWMLKQAAKLCTKTFHAPLIADHIVPFVKFKVFEIIWRACAAGADMKLFAESFLSGELDQPEFHSHCTAGLDERRAMLSKYLPEEAVNTVFSEETGLLDRLQKQADDFLIEAIGEAKGIAFGPERVFGYLCGLQQQTYNLRLCIAGKVNSIHADLLRSRLRRTYA